ncbi:Imm51 family immunity protein [Faecalibacterium prausnitzii]|uniref:Imm51 family immunity protein n=1 Tax=Faecalibacterium prausnitzii TaxID=853 RepID=UPI003F1A20A3
MGLTGSSGDWERLVRGVIREFEKNNSGMDLFHFDSDEDVFCVYSRSRQDSNHPPSRRQRWAGCSPCPALSS